MDPPPIRPGQAFEATNAFVSVRCATLRTRLLRSGGAGGAQAPTVDTTLPGLPGSSASLMGPAPARGVVRSAIYQAPAAAGRSSRPVRSQGRSHVCVVAGKRPGTDGAANAGIGAQPQPVSPTSTPFFGTLEVPSQNDDGPPDGVTLDRAIDITLERSLDLQGKFFEIPMARADILQANLRSNPVFYQDGQLLQYRGSSTQFNRAAPGGPSQFDTNISYPLDISHKRQARTRVASLAERVLEAQYSGCRPEPHR